MALLLRHILGLVLAVLVLSLLVFRMTAFTPLHDDTPPPLLTAPGVAVTYDRGGLAPSAPASDDRAAVSSSSSSTSAAPASVATSAPASGSALSAGAGKTPERASLPGRAASDNGNSVLRDCLAWWTRLFNVGAPELWAALGQSALLATLTLGLMLPAVPLGFAAARGAVPCAWGLRTLGALLRTLPFCTLGLLLLAGAAFLPASLAGLRQPAALPDPSQLAPLLPALCLACLLGPRLCAAADAAMRHALANPALRRAHLRGLDAGFIAHLARREALGRLLLRAGVGCALLVSFLVAVETLFAWPGLGRTFLQAALHNDGAVLRGTAMFLLVPPLLVQTLARLVRRDLDPRPAQACVHEARPL